MKPDPYSFHCTPCRKSHAGECPPKMVMKSADVHAINAALDTNWAAFLPASPTYKDPTDQWMRGAVYYAHVAASGTRLVFRVLDLSKSLSGDMWSIEILASGSLSYPVGAIRNVNRRGGLGNAAVRIVP